MTRREGTNPSAGRGAEDTLGFFLAGARSAARRDFSFAVMEQEPANFDARRCARFLMDTAVRRADDAFDDAVGMLRAGDTLSGALRARDAVEFSIDALIYAYGRTNDRAKFRIQRLRRLAATIPSLAPHVQKLWEIERAIPDGENERALYIGIVHRHCPHPQRGARTRMLVPAACAYYFLHQDQE